MPFNKLQIAVFIALLFHVSGAIGMLGTTYADWFVQNTALNLVIMLALIIWTQPEKNTWFFLFFFIAFMVGMATEMIGVNTGKLFGQYKYGTVMGPKFNGVPYLIGINWFVVVYCSGVIMTFLNDWIEEKYLLAGVIIKPWIKQISFVIDAALLTTFFDYVLEPVAIRLQFWQWHNQIIPLYNYVCWFIISALLLLVFRAMPFKKHNHFAIHLFIIQFLFFVALQIFL
ncbi:MAG: carotenoid biosynthesis protein [Chitinophagaceae bacterium]